MKRMIKFLTLGVASLIPMFANSAQSDWIPVFNDEPVPPARAAEIEAALPKEPIVASKADRKILVYSATAGFRHGSIPTGKLALERMGLATGSLLDCGE